MNQRCTTNPTSEHFKHYSGRGIAVCERWKTSFEAFKQDMGERPSKASTLDRIDNQKGYEPGNCRWVTMAEQNKNRSHCVLLTHNGTTQNITEWAQALNMRPQTLTERLRLGWTTERALTEPVKTRRTK